MAKGEIDVDDFCEYLQKKTEEFRKYWKKQSKASPAEYPNTLPMEVWVDQHMVWEMTPQKRSAE